MSECSHVGIRVRNILKYCIISEACLLENLWICTADSYVCICICTVETHQQTPLMQIAGVFLLENLYICAADTHLRTYVFVQ